MKNNTLTLKDETEQASMGDNGEKKDYRILLDIEDTTNKINYVIYTDDETNKKGETICYASTYVRSSKGNMTKLKPVIMKEEFDFIEKILSSLEEKE